MTNSVPAQHTEHTPHRDELRDEQGNVVCAICQAVYTPSQWYVHLLQGPPIALESAFMSMCHFCFRCRRPACPECWDDVNGVCGGCAQDTQLPFRGSARPFTGTLFAPAQRVQEKRERREVDPLVCVQHGRFMTAPTYTEDVAEIPTWPLRGRRAQAITWQRHVEEEICSLVEQPTKPGHRQPPTEHITDVQGRDSTNTRGEHAAETEKIADLKIRPEQRKRRRGTQWFEYISTLILSTILLAALFLVVLAFVSGHANAFIAAALHIDIRAEIAYLQQLVQNIHL